MQTWHPAACLATEPARPRRAGGQSCGLFCVSDVHVPGSIHHRRPLHGIYRGHHITGEKGNEESRPVGKLCHIRSLQQEKVKDCSKE